MDYPKTIGTALDILQGNWTIKGKEVSFTIEDMRTTNPTGLIDNYDQPIQHSADFSIKKNKPTEKWAISGGYIFGMGSDIIYWDEQSFKTSSFPIHITEPDSGTSIEPDIITFLRRN